MPAPTLEDQLLGLSPRAKVLIGVGTCLLGAVLTVVLWDAGLVWGAALFAFGLGLAVTGIGLRERRRGRSIATEVERAQREWPELQRGIVELRANGGNVARFLQQRGYREFGVRRWIAREMPQPADHASGFDEDLPMPTSVLRDLFALLERESGNGYECDHAFTLSRRHFAAHGLDAGPPLTWLGGQGAGCDCEVMFNVASRWATRIGWSERPDAYSS